MELTVKKSDSKLQIVYAEVYAPEVLDSDGDFMRANEIRKMAHKFLADMNTRKIDTNHDNQLVDAVVVESFIAREGDPEFIADAWVVGVHIADKDLWAKVEDGEINGFSMEAAVIRTERIIEIEVPESVTGVTEEVDGHTHTFTVLFDEEGKFLGGVTDLVEGHIHTIVRGTHTDKADDHTHRFSFVEAFR
jgi:hypothetical protein